MCDTIDCTDIPNEFCAAARGVRTLHRAASCCVQRFEQPALDDEIADIHTHDGRRGGNYEPCVPVEERVASDAKVASASVPAALTVALPAA
jgi:hypothetical protein